MSELKMFRLRHKPTGLFFTPKKSGHSHLGLKGKVFTYNVKVDHAVGRLTVPGSYYPNSPIRKRIIEALGLDAIKEERSTIEASIESTIADWELIQEK